MIDTNANILIICIDDCLFKLSIMNEAPVTILSIT